MAVFTSNCVEYGNTVTAYPVPPAQAPITGQTFIGPKMESSAFSGAKRVRQVTSYAHNNADAAYFDGSCAPLHGDLFWFNHIHLIPRSYTLGNVLTNQVREWDIFNGWRSNRVITGVVENGADGFTLTSQPTASPNTTIGPLGTIRVTADISTIGPVTINFTSTYSFATGEVLTMTITGNRVVIMSTIPEYNIDEDFAWYTDVIESASGKEQRISQRDVARQRWTYRFTRQYQDLSWLENQLWAWAANNWGIPVWTDVTVTTADITADVDFVIPVADTSKRDFRATDAENVYLALLWTDEQTFEAIEVVSFTGTTITTVNPVLNSFPAGTFIMPLRTMVMTGGYKQRNPNYNARSFEVQWEPLVPYDYGEGNLSPNPFVKDLYLTVPVWDYATFPLQTGGSYNIEEDKDIIVFDDKLGRLSTFTDRKFPQNRFSGVQVETFGRDDHWDFKHYISQLRGRWKAIWVSTQQADFVIESNSAAPSNTINVVPTNYATLIWNAVDGPKTRQHIEIVYVDGTKDYRQITNAALTSSTRETLTLDTGISQDTDQIERISWLIRRRLSTDKITFQHRWQENEVEMRPFGFIDVLDSDT